MWCMCCCSLARAQTQTAADSFDPELADVQLLDAVEMHTLLQTRYVASFAEPSHNPRPGYAVREHEIVHDGAGFDLRRLYLRISASPSAWLSSKLVLNFAK